MIGVVVVAFFVGKRRQKNKDNTAALADKGEAGVKNKGVEMDNISSISSNSSKPGNGVVDIGGDLGDAGTSGGDIGDVGGSGGGDAGGSGGDAGGSGGAD